MPFTDHLSAFGYFSSKHSPEKRFDNAPAGVESAK